MAATDQGCQMMTVALAMRIAELRACENVRALHIVTLDGHGGRALVLLVPHAEDKIDGGGWEQPREPFLMLIDSKAMHNGHALH